MPGSFWMLSGKRSMYGARSRHGAGSPWQPRQPVSADDVDGTAGSIGNSHDNPLAVTIKGLLKAEVIHCRRPWRSFEAVEYAPLEQVDWFSNRCLLQPIGIIPPAEAEANFHTGPETDPRAAKSRQTSLQQTRHSSFQCCDPVETQISHGASWSHMTTTSQ